MFGQSWAGAPAWNSMPLVNYHMDRTFQPGVTPNRGFNSNQQIDAQVYSEDDDYFYDNEDYQPINTSQLTVDSNERSKASMPSETRESPLPRQVMTSDQAPASAISSQAQANGTSLSVLKSANTTSLPTQVSKERQGRMDELRAKLLASKRARSTTPLPPTSGIANGTTAASSVSEHIKTGATESTARSPSKGQIDAETPSIEISTAQADVESSLCSPRAPTSPLANADIQGLINEYRAVSGAASPRAASGGRAYPNASNPPSTPRLKEGAKAEAAEAVKGPEVPSLASTKEFPPLPLSSGEKIGVSSKSSAPQAVPQFIEPNGHAKPQCRSPGSSESGEIRSDQEPESISAKHDSGPAITTANSKPGIGSETSVTALTPDQRFPPNLRSGRTDISDLKAAPSTPKQELAPQAQDRRKSTQPPSETHSFPLAQQSDKPQRLAVQSLSRKTTPRTNSQRDVVGDEEDSQLPRKPSLPSGSASTGRPDSSAASNSKLARQESRYALEANEDRTSESKKPATKQHQIPSKSQATSAGSESSFSIRGTAHDALTSDNRTEPVESVAQESRPRTQSEVTSGVPGRQEPILSLSQQEQILKLGIDLTPGGLQDLYDFLYYHRFFVKEYREGFLARQRRIRAVYEEKRALDEEKLALERESLKQYELFNSVRAHLLAASEPSERPILAALEGEREANETPSKPMPPPLSIPKKSNVEGAASINGKNDSSAGTPIRSTVSQSIEQLPSDGSSLKRRHVDDNVDLDRGRKFTRVSDVEKRDRSQPVSPRTRQPEAQAPEPRRPSDSRVADYGYRGRSSSPSHRRRILSFHSRPLDQQYPPRQNSWAAPYDRGPNRPRPSKEELRRDSRGALCHHCDRVGHFSVDCPDEHRDSYGRRPVFQRGGEYEHDGYEPGRPSRGKYSFSSASGRGGSRGRAGHSNKSFRHDSTPHQSNPARAGAPAPTGSESLNLQAGGQSRSTSLSADLP